MTPSRIVPIVVLLACAWPQAVGPSQTPAQPVGIAVTTVRTFTHPLLGMTVVASDVDLPPGDWTVLSSAPAALDQIFLVSHVQPEDALGRRMSVVTRRQVAAMAQFRLQSLFEPIVEYAATHAGLGPKSFSQLDPQAAAFIDEATRSPWPEDADRVPPVPYLFLIPGTRIQMIPPRPLDGARGRPGETAATRAPLIIELRPLEDDGRHWVVFSNGEVQRVPIDAALVAKYALTIDPVRRGESTPRAAGVLIRHTVLALRRDAAAPAVTLLLAETSSSERRQVRWTLKGGTTDDALLGEWATARAWPWYVLAARTQSPILSAWLDRSAAIYGDTALSRLPRMRMPFDGGGGEPRAASAFDLLGGRAALRETLQMELLRPRGGTPDPLSSFKMPIANVRGVDVASLPFEKMLAGRTGGRIALADYVPDDRLLIYFAKPSAVFPFLSQGGDLVGRAGSTMTTTAFDDDLKRRYLRRLGLAEESSRQLLESGAITELALTAPDLFFIDGTDLTILMRLRDPALAATALKALAGVDVTGTAIAEKPTIPGRAAYWARQGDVLAISTNRREIERAFRTGQAATGGLGRSAELRYMLSELPLRSETRAFVYLSDAFVRRVVGPAVKIGQLRRMRAAADMSLITAGALLYRLDGHRDVPDIAQLARLGYVPPYVAIADYRLQPDFSVVSGRWGTLADLTTLESAPVDMVTPDEAAAYQTYCDEYRRYWRQYFDPIGMRLDDAADGAMELTTFILPLVESDLYNQLRGVIETRESGRPLRVPQVKPDPVLQFSLNLTNESWLSVASGVSQLFSQYTGINPELFDLFGPGLHIAIQDADPVISLGTSDLLGAFGASSMGMRLDMGLPFVFSMLTRPCKIFIELQDAPRALAIMRRAASASIGPGREVNLSFRQIGNRDAWTYTLGVSGFLTLRLGLAIQDGFLVISNIPWSEATTVERVETRSLNGGAIAVRPEAVKLGLASLFTTQAEQDQTAALASMAALLPLLQTIATSPADAAARHAALFGSTPLHPGRGEWMWSNGRLESSAYGSATRWKSPAFDPSNGDFGLFDGATLLDLTMQFEQGGLRAVARWKWQDRPGR